ncbi:peripherin-2-like [Leptidea sinapis]|uniref:peripherin-2-like n=1 Tax=Leptidea sinapis TaxID=189913 RepID=UPI0021334AD3|nr:peripherin-2-like [Leptidea sinapis]
MGWAGLTFSNDGRERLANILRALLISQLVISLVMAIYCYNVSFRVLSLLKNIHKLTVFLLYGLILMQAYSMKLHYTGGLRLLTFLLRSPYWPRAASVSKLWMISGSVVALNGLLVSAACKSTLKALMRELSSSLRVGISQYLTEPEWKTLLDTMQIELNCCGADQPSDWYDIPWINIDYLNADSDIVMKLSGSDGKILPPVAPYSCCTPRLLAPCYHDLLQQWEWRSAWSSGSPLVGASVEARGCVEAVRDPLTRAALALQMCALLSVVLQVIIVSLTQVIRSSGTDAMLRGDLRGEGSAGGPTRGVGTAPPPSTTDMHEESEVCIRRSTVRAHRNTSANARERMRVRRLRSRLSYPYLS